MPQTICLVSFGNVKSEWINEHLSIITYGLNVYVLPKFICQNPNPQCEGVRNDAFGKLLGHQSGAPVNEIGALTTRDTAEMISLHCEDSARKKPSLNQEEGPHQTWLCWDPDLRLPASRTMRNKYLIFIYLPVYGIFVIAVQGN